MVVIAKFPEPIKPSQCTQSPDSGLFLAEGNFFTLSGKSHCFLSLSFVFPLAQLLQSCGGGSGSSAAPDNLSRSLLWFSSGLVSELLCLTGPRVPSKSTCLPNSWQSRVLDKTNAVLSYSVVGAGSYLCCCCCCGRGLEANTASPLLLVGELRPLR